MTIKLVLRLAAPFPTKVDCARDTFFNAENLLFLFRENDLVSNSDVKVWLLSYFTELTTCRAKSLTTQYLTPPIRYAGMLSQNHVIAQAMLDKCKKEWAVLLQAESAFAGGASIPALNGMHWRLGALTTTVSWQISATFSVCPLNSVGSCLFPSCVDGGIIAPTPRFTWQQSSLTSLHLGQLP